MLTQRQILLLAVIVLFVYYTSPNWTKKAVADVRGAAQEIRRDTVAVAKAVQQKVSTAVNVPQNADLPSQPRNVQVAPPGYEGFAQVKKRAGNRRDNFGNQSCSEEVGSINQCQFTQKSRFSQEGTSTPAPAQDTAPNASAAPSCPGIGQIISENRFNPILAKEKKSTHLGDQELYSYLGENHMHVQPGWEGNFANDAQSEQIVNSILHDPTRKFVSTPPQATKSGKDIRAMPCLSHSVIDQLKLMPTITQLMTDTGLGWENCMVQK